jgi:hypothetical protein
MVLVNGSGRRRNRGDPGLEGDGLSKKQSGRPEARKQFGEDVTVEPSVEAPTPTPAAKEWK